MPDFVKALHSGRVLLMDGAMGTELFRAGVPRDSPLDELIVKQPDVVERIHRAYIDAGAQVLLTHTFQVKAPEQGTLQRIGACEQTYLKAIETARVAAGGHRFVVLGVGPLAGSWRRYAELIVFDFDRRDVDAIVFETCSTAKDAERCLKYQLQNVPGNARLPILISWTFRKGADGRIGTEFDEPPEACASKAAGLRVAALGVNCGRDIAMADILEIVRRYRTVTDLPFFVRPNAGTPKLVDGQWVYPETPESMAAWLPELFKAGVVMIGGCCGTTPAHIAAFRRVVDDWNKSHARSGAEF